MLQKNVTQLTLIPQNTKMLIDNTKIIIPSQIISLFDKLHHLKFTNWSYDKSLNKMIKNVFNKSLNNLKTLHVIHKILHEQTIIKPSKLLKLLPNLNNLTIELHRHNCHNRFYLQDFIKNSKTETNLVIKTYKYPTFADFDDPNRNIKLILCLDLSQYVQSIDEVMKKVANNITKIKKLILRLQTFNILEINVNMALSTFTIPPENIHAVIRNAFHNDILSSSNAKRNEFQYSLFIEKKIKHNFITLNNWYQFSNDITFVLDFPIQTEISNIRIWLKKHKQISIYLNNKLILKKTFIKNVQKINWNFDIAKSKGIFYDKFKVLTLKIKKQKDNFWKSIFC